MSKRTVVIVAVVVVLLGIAVAAFLADGGIAPRGTPRQQLTAWVTNTGFGQSLGTIYSDNTHVTDVIDLHHGTNAIHTICGVLANDAESANSSLPSPDTAVTDLLSKGYTLEYQAGLNCYKAGSLTPKVLAKSLTQRKQAAKIFHQVVKDIAALTGQPLSTTTTIGETTSTTGLF